MRLNQLSQRAYSFVCERYLGIETTGFVAPTVEFAVHYTPLPYRVLRRIFNQLSLGEQDVFVDIGCGKGRVVCCASRFKISRVVAIEINEELLAQTVQNSAKVRNRKTPVEALAMPAEEYHYQDATVIYLYNPFGRPIMDKVFGRIDESFRKRPRKLRVAYVNCLHEDSLRGTGWLQKVQHWPATDFPGFDCPISFWESREA
jgi:SAM-dependent methyltransferase